MHALVMERVVSIMGTSLLGLLALGIPATFFGLSYGARNSTLLTRAEIKSEVISQHIAQSPTMWRFEQTRLQDLMRRVPAMQAGEQIRLLSIEGDILAETGLLPASPILTHRVELYDAGRLAGRLEMHSSLRNLLVQSLLTALLTIAAASLLYRQLQRLLRSNRQVTALLRDEQERARVTLDSIGDAVITTDREERITYMNPVAARLTQWSPDEARGLLLHQVSPLVNEYTKQPLPSRMTRALRGESPPETGRLSVALLRRDGSQLPIEESAAPLCDASATVIGGVMVFRDVTANRRMAQRMSWAASHDALTGLLNRAEFESCVDNALASSRDSDRRYVMCYLDLDQFKVVNDTSGHAAGDLLLKQLADVLQAHLRKSDVLARLGGDEFGLLLEGCTLERSLHIAADLQAAIREHRFVHEGKSFQVGTSIGIVPIGPEARTRAEVFAEADAACYAAKEQGRNRIVVYRTSDVDLKQRRQDMGWAARLRAALEQDRFVLHYQAYLPLNPSSPGGRHIELLLRLLDERGTLVMPGQFMPAAERYALMPDIDRWVIHQAFSRYRELASALGEPLTCSINLSGTTINSEGILDYIQQQLEQYPLPPGVICFEVTETAAIHNMRKAATFMAELKSKGFSFALDDFGVGTSSLSYLRSLPVDYLKIDGSFVRNIGRDPIDRAMVETINRVGHIMGLQTVGEYAESSAVIEALRELGVDFAQGHGVHRPQALPLITTAPQGEAGPSAPA
jgi:diguanylate cyclase (GGDEF)-like protein/PAS domain S-box-containing protein